jgi:hypothetical protein
MPSLEGTGAESLAVERWCSCELPEREPLKSAAELEATTPSLEVEAEVESLAVARFLSELLENPPSS